MGSMVAELLTSPDLEFENLFALFPLTDIKFEPDRVLQTFLLNNFLF